MSGGAYARSNAGREQDAAAKPPECEMVNPQYPTSWWIVGHSREVAQGEVVPLRVLERDLVVWRDSDAKLHCQDAQCPHLGAHLGFGGHITGDCVVCPFHGYAFDGSGLLAGRPGDPGHAPARLRLRTHRVVERFGCIFLWNGFDPPDHKVSEVIDNEIMRQAGRMVSDDEFTPISMAFLLPVPAKSFVENLPDGVHFARVHFTAEWGEVRITEESGLVDAEYPAPRGRVQRVAPAAHAVAPRCALPVRHQGAVR